MIEYISTSGPANFKIILHLQKISLDKNFRKFMLFLFGLNTWYENFTRTITIQDLKKALLLLPMVILKFYFQKENVFL